MEAYLRMLFEKLLDGWGFMRRKIVQYDVNLARAHFVFPIKPVRNAMKSLLACS